MSELGNQPSQAATPGSCTFPSCNCFDTNLCGKGGSGQWPGSDKSRILHTAVAAVLEADKEFRSNMPKDWEGDPLSDEIDGLRRIFEATPSPKPQTAEHAQTEAVAWRFRAKGGRGTWSLRYEKPDDPAQLMDIEPLYSQPPEPQMKG